MFNFFNRKKKAKILVVVNGDASVPVDYYSKVDVSMEVEVKVACNELAIEVTDNDVRNIVEMLLRGESYWLKETWGFQVIEVEV